MQNPRESHWKAAKRILRYVRGTVQFGIHYSARAAPQLVGFTDSDWAGDLDDRKSTAGYVFTLGSGPITWACKKQAAISLSSAEAEYRGAVEASKEALWLRQILSEFGFEQPSDGLPTLKRQQGKEQGGWSSFWQQDGVHTLPNSIPNSILDQVELNYILCVGIS